jgi:opacity protein-like surface antigen
MCVLRRMIGAASLLGSLSLLPSVALAEPPPSYNWTGLSIYAGGGGAAYRGDAGTSDPTTYDFTINALNGFFVREGTLPLSNARSTMSGGGAFGTFGLAADFEPTRGVVVGAFADIDLYDGGASFSNSSSIAGAISTSGGGNQLQGGASSTTNVAGKLNYDYSTTIGGRVGILSLDRRALAYVLAGWTRLEAGGTAQVNSVGVGSVTFTGGVPPQTYSVAGSVSNAVTVSLPGTYDGFTFGVGTQAKLDSNWSLKLEGRYTNLGSETVGYFGSASGFACALSCSLLKLSATSTSAGRITIEPEIWSARVALSYEFN